MGFDLGLMGAAYVGAKAAERQRRNDDYEQAVRDYQLADMKERADSRDGRIAVENARLNDAQQTYASRAQLRPKQTENAELGLDAQNSELRFQAGQQPTIQQTKALQNGDALEMAKADHAMIPQVVATKMANGLLSVNQARDHVTAGLASMINAGDFAGAVPYANEVMKIPGLMPNADGRTVAKVEQVELPNGKWAARMSDDQGKVISEIPAERLLQAYNSTIGKGQAVNLGPNHKMVDSRTGRVIATNPYTPPAYAFGGDQYTPQEIKLYNWATGNDKAHPIAKPMTHEQALDFAKKAKSKSREDFVTEFSAKDPNFLNPDPQTQITVRKKYEQLWNDVHGTSNSDALINISPKVKDLLSP